MKCLSVLAAAALSVLALGQAVNLNGLGGFNANSPYNNLWNRQTVVTFSGKVTGVQMAPPMKGMAEGTSIIVKAKNGGSIDVELGPTWFIRNQETKIRLGDQVKVTGSKVRIMGDTVILASQVVRGKQVLALRDGWGRPYWDANRNGFVEDPTLRRIEGSLVSEEVIVVDGVEWATVVVQTENGPVRYGIAPMWYLRQQEFPFQVGSNVVVTSRTEPLRIGNVILADSVFNGSSSLWLRTGVGRPIWLAWGR